jgi:hypothetical protein
MISHELRCIFIHVPKTAGTSVERKLGHFQKLTRGVQDHRTLRDIQTFTFWDAINPNSDFTGPYSRRKVIKAYLRSQYNQAAGLITKEQYRTYYKFSIVRNSWSRVLSWYKNVMLDDVHQKQLGISPGCSFKKFIIDYPNQWALKSQLFWLIDKRGRLPYDFIGSFENLNDDFAKICNDLNIEDKSLPKLLTSTHKTHYTDHYDDDTKRIVAERYQDEIKLFGFKFGE